MEQVVNTIEKDPRFNRDVSAGPLSKSRLRRTKTFFFALAVIGLLPSLFNLSPALQSAGLGLLWPGGGFAAMGGWALAMLPLFYALYWITLVVWFGSGNILAPITIWVLGAVVPAALIGGNTEADTWPYGVYLILALVALREGRDLYKNRKQLRDAIARREQRKAYLREALQKVDERAVAEPVPGSRELDDKQLASARYLFDRALQPVGEFVGYNKIDQFQTSALRYQLNTVGYALGEMQCHYTPNFHGYLNTAQQRLIEQMLQRPIWGYWPLENMWGNFNFNFDPCAKDNIMLTGFFGLQICQYMSNTGDMRYAEPGSLTFIYNDKKVYKHDIHSVIGSIVKNQNEQAFCLYPCEPNWVYTPCNFMGMKALALYDRLFGTHHFRDIYPSFIEKLDAEFTQADGSVIALRSNLTGFAVPFPFADDGRALYFNPIDHQRAKEAWGLARQEMFYEENGKLKIKLEGKGVDMGNYSQGHQANIQNILSAAREFGDEEAANTAEALLEEMYPPQNDNGTAVYPGSCSTNTTLARAFMLGTNDYRNSILKGPAETALQGPILTGVEYPQVLVAKAFSHTGKDLELVLVPGKGDCEVDLRIERLAPGGTYTAKLGEDATSVTADDNGTAILKASLTTRLRVVLTPAA
ncbi:hypothetical protein HCU74_04030 [Spongiibacter sp. KMU-166]|uniref:Linalool dehydratase/isomerase domain-containing protein n=1 Tax=Spongiibacter thalassae TaxID=2721624 RepID=A0ABX1GDW8_9GAMM|nr:hypothetical protein [Spongiibacter thalassae]NKI16587.1 hypothetical protein [Spongiibacter thalassae]